VRTGANAQPAFVLYRPDDRSGRLWAAFYARAVLCEDIGVNCALAARTPLALSTWAGRTGIDPPPRLGAPIDWPAWARSVRLDCAYPHEAHADGLGAPR